MRWQSDSPCLISARFLILTIALCSDSSKALMPPCQRVVKAYFWCLVFGFFFFFPAVVKRILDFLGNVLCKYSVVEVMQYKLLLSFEKDKVLGGKMHTVSETVFVNLLLPVRKTILSSSIMFSPWKWTFRILEVSFIMKQRLKPGFFSVC